MMSIDPIYNMEISNLIEESYYESIVSPEILYQEGQNQLIEILEVTGNGVTKTNSGNRLWEFLRKVFRWIKERVMQFVNFIKRFFTKKMKSADQILSDIGVEPAPQKVDTGKEMQPVSVPVNAHPNSTATPSELKVLIKDLMVRFDSDSQSITLSINDAANNGNYDDLDQRHKQGKAPGQGLVNNFRTKIALGIAIMAVPNLANEMVQLAMALNPKTIDETWTNRFNKWWDAIPGQVNNDYRITLEAVNHFQRKLNEVHAYLEKIDSPDSSDNSPQNRYLIQSMNTFAARMSDLQMGINSLTSIIQSSYQVDARFQGSVKDVEKLSLFVDDCIKAGFPPKFIANNCYLISSSSIKGDGSKGNMENPIWGQSRLVFFPPNSTSNNGPIVLKIALSGWGVRANKSESSITQKFLSADKTEGMEIIAPVLATTKSSSVISAEKVLVKDEKEVTKNEIDLVVSKLNQFTAKHQIPLDISGDIHEGNVGYRNGQPLATDYGMASRTA